MCPDTAGVIIRHLSVRTNVFVSTYNDSSQACIIFGVSDILVIRGGNGAVPSRRGVSERNRELHTAAVLEAIMELLFAVAYSGLQWPTWGAVKKLYFYTMGGNCTQWGVTVSLYLSD